MSAEEKTTEIPLSEEIEKETSPATPPPKPPKKRTTLWTDGHRQYVFDEVVELVYKGLAGASARTAGVRRVLESAKIGGVTDADVVRFCAECNRRLIRERDADEEKAKERARKGPVGEKPPLTDVTLREAAPVLRRASLDEDSERRIHVPPSKAPFCADAVLWSQISKAAGEEDDDGHIEEACLDGVTIIVAASILKKITRRETEFYYQVPSGVSLFQTHLEDILGRLSVLINYDLDVERTLRGDGSLVCLRFSLGDLSATSRGREDAPAAVRERLGDTAYGTPYEYDHEAFDLEDEEDPETEGAEGEEDEEVFSSPSSDEESSPSFLAKALSRLGPQQPVKED